MEQRDASRLEMDNRLSGNPSQERSTDNEHTEEHYQRFSHSLKKPFNQRNYHSSNNRDLKEPTNSKVEREDCIAADTLHPCCNKQCNQADKKTNDRIPYWSQEIQPSVCLTHFLLIGLRLIGSIHTAHVSSGDSPGTGWFCMLSGLRFCCRAG